MTVFLRRGYTNFIFDVSDVLLTWPSDLTCPIDRKVLRSCLVSGTWFRYESGAISKEECLQRLSARFSLEPSVIDDAWKHVTHALRPNTELIALIKEIKAAAPGKVRVFGASNVSALDYEYFRSRTDLDWSIFDAVFTSHELGTRLCSPGFFKRLPEHVQINYEDAVYVGHIQDADDVVNARSFGMHGILLGDLKENRREMLNLVGDPVKRGWEYLRANAGKHASELDKSAVTFTDNFSQLLILEATGDRSLVTLTEPSRHWNYFQGKGLLTYEKFPDDLDTTSLGLVTMKPSKELVHSIMDEMLKCLSPDGLPYSYFDPELPRLDPALSVNVLHLFYTHGRGHQLPGALEWVRSVLQNRAYLQGTRYYFAESILFFVGRLLQTSDDAHLHETLEDLLRECVQELIGAPGDSLALAFRIITCASLGIEDDIDMRSLLPLQREDGGWEIGWLTKYGISGMKVGSRGYTTAMAIKAIEDLDRLRAKVTSA
ncbi:HAD-like domain-containing protein [Cerioporus squamosus]|nr:HAD-like domain-containing protein [Cerioporus squamosus]